MENEVVLAEVVEFIAAREAILAIRSIRNAIDEGAMKVPYPSFVTAILNANVIEIENAIDVARTELIRTLFEEA